MQLESPVHAIIAAYVLVRIAACTPRTRPGAPERREVVPRVCRLHGRRAPTQLLSHLAPCQRGGTCIFLSPCAESTPETICTTAQRPPGGTPAVTDNLAGFSGYNISWYSLTIDCYHTLHDGAWATCGLVPRACYAGSDRDGLHTHCRAERL
jgi:hypothetical protein